MINTIDIKCSDNYYESLKDLFSSVEIIDDNNILYLNDIKCNIDRNLYIEQSILRSCISNNINLENEDKLILGLSLSKKTKRFYKDVSKELFEDFSIISQGNSKDMYDEVRKQNEMSYIDFKFKNDLILSSKQIKESTIFYETSLESLEEYNKNYKDILNIFRNMTNIININIHICMINGNEKNLLIYTKVNNLDNVYCKNIIHRDEDFLLVKLSKEYKKNKCLKDLGECLNCDKN